MKGMEADDLLCSRNARPEKALVGRAQWKIHQPPSLKDNKRAWTEHLYRSTRAIKGSLAAPYAERTVQAGMDPAYLDAIDRIIVNL
jgi:hypothetical protein